MDFPAIYQQIDTLLEEERLDDAKILIDEQLALAKYSVLTKPKQDQLSLWEEKWQLQLLICKFLIIQFKPNEIIILTDKILEESRILDQFTTKIQVLAFVAKANALLLLGQFKETQQLIQEVESRTDDLDNISQEEKHNLRVSMERMNGYMNHVFGQSELALTHIKNSLELCRQETWSMRGTQILEGLVYIDTGQYSKGFRQLRQINEYCKNNGLVYSYGWSLLNLALYAFQVGHLVSAKEYGLNLIKFSKEVRSKLLEAWAQTTLGGVALALGELFDAETLLISSYKDFKSIGNLWFQFPARRLGALYRIQGDFDKAIFYLTESLEVVKINGFEFVIGLQLNLIGEVYYAQNQIQEARTYFEQALEYINRFGTKFLSAKVTFNLFLILIETGEISNAEQQLFRLKEIAEQEKHPTNTNHKILAEALYQMQSPKLLEKAQAQQKLYNLVKEQNLEVNLLIMAYFNLFNLYLLEWKISEDKTTLDEIYQIFNKIQELAKNQSIFPLEVELHLLRALLTIVQGNLSQAESYITEAIEIAQKHEYTHLISKSFDLKAKIQSQVKEWKDLLDENATYSTPS
ncbi:MAG: tetratricopeptide repeat protein [Candidatus Hodarchaeales archaeon]|jgi:tetratricopeptide (TPR) repeat protein